MESVTIGTRYFQSKVRAEKFIRSILRCYGKDQQLNAEDTALALALLERHPNKEWIKGPGIKSVHVQWLDEDKGEIRRFIVKRKDDSRRDFTWRHALFKRDAMAEVSRVCRTLCRGQIDAFKAKAFAQDIALKCPISGRRITKDECEVDHVAPDTFAALVERWLKSNGINAYDIAIVPSTHYQEPDQFEDEFLAQNWREFHRINAKLRVLHPVAHQALSKKPSNGSKPAA